MAVLNAAKREIDIKIVYYGPALCGKTTNVQCIHKKLAPDQRGDMMTLATKDDRTLFFDFLPIELGNVKGFKTRFHIYTVPGQVYYALTRRAVLTSVDGVVFVADSQQDKMAENLESLQDLEDNLHYHKKDLAAIPFVLQYNKQDLPKLLPVAELDSALNKLRVPSFTASAINGTGVMETLTACCKLVLKHLNKSSGRTPRARESVAPAYEESMDADEPIIRITREEAPPLEMQAQETPPEFPAAEDIPEVPSGIAGGVEESSPAETELGLEEPLRLNEEDAAVPAEEGSLDDDRSPQSPAESIDQEIGLTLETPAVDIQDDVGGDLKIAACGQLKKISDHAVAVPVTFQSQQTDKQYRVTITITFDGLKLSG